MNMTFTTMDILNSVLLPANDVLDHSAVITGAPVHEDPERCRLIRVKKEHNQELKWWEAQTLCSSEQSSDKFSLQFK